MPVIKNISQSPSSIFMIRPHHFGFNEETAGSNAFQNENFIRDFEAATRAQIEFDEFVEKLMSTGISVRVFDENNPKTPDAVYPNNWISFHEDGKVVLYPMMAKNRRLERREDIICSIQKEYDIVEVLDLTKYENQGKYLEGTGSIVFDYSNKVAYACRSPRTDEELFNICCRELGYKPLLFDAVDRHGRSIYHTNVLMALADDFCVICLESIKEKQRSLVTGMLQETNHKILNISFDQMDRFAGNMIQLSDNFGEKYMVMSEFAYKSLEKDQLDLIVNYTEPIHSDLMTIETLGGGSARCMITGIYLETKKRVKG